MKGKLINFIKKIKKLKINDKRILIVTIISLLSLLTLVSTSLAIFLTERNTDPKDLFSTGDLVIAFDEENGNAISINPAKPVSDEYGSTLDPYTFTISNNGTYKSTYEIRLVDSASLTTDAINNLKPVLKYQIDDNAPAYLKDTNNQVVISGVLSPNQTKTHDFRMWIAYEATSVIEGLTYSGSLSLSGKAVNYKKIVSTNGNEVLTGSSSGNSINNLKIYGNTVDGVSVGTLDDATGKYNVEVIASGRNFIDNTRLLMTDNSRERWEVTATGIRQTKTSIYGYTLRTLYDITDFVKPNTTYYFHRETERNFNGLTSTTNALSGSVRPAVDGQGIEGSTLYTGPTDKVVTMPSEFEKMEIITWTVPSNNMLENPDENVEYYFEWKNLYISTLPYEGYEPYQEPKTYNITLNEPLRSNGETKDYIDFEQGKVVRWIASDGSILETPTEETVTLPSITTLNGTTILSVNGTVPATFEGNY